MCIGFFIFDFRDVSFYDYIVNDKILKLVAVISQSSIIFVIEVHCPMSIHRSSYNDSNVLLCKVNKIQKYVQNVTSRFMSIIQLYIDNIIKYLLVLKKFHPIFTCRLPFFDLKLINFPFNFELILTRKFSKKLYLNLVIICCR